MIKILNPKERSRLLILGTIIAGGSALILSSPHWVTVVRNHGANIFLESLQSQNSGTLFIIDAITSLMRFQITKGEFHFIWNAIIFGGVIWGVIMRRWQLLGIFLLLFSVPREGSWLVATPTTIFAGAGAAMLFSPLLANLENWHKKKFGNLAILVLIGVTLFLGPYSILRDKLSDKNHVLSL